MKIHAIFLAFVMLMPTLASAESSVHIVDGDTLDIDGVRYRLHGIDAPEAGQACAGSDGSNWACGQEAIRQIEELTYGKTVQCDARGQDAYGRTLSVCTADGVEVNARMVETGMAWAFRKYSVDYANLEETAKQQGIGIWQAPTEAAWDFRAHKWDASLTDVPDGKCPIKGNINRKNERIYHVPWSRDYGKTKINVSNGERWFCSEEEALSAGWRAPLWGK
ncbi:thermonuclease family protein [Rhizobium sp. GN54]|uniref:thermonuclease family protein n=1 Tax=Rhizobium sp. GN54 TaxID=2898150 RepID=UPI001E5E56C3|nr:thermonuclease family protein [Rhizobium sp. GN54]MCD2183663.1 thermonuclease family protein [Rhizobium sp. GN54]